MSLKTPKVNKSGKLQQPSIYGDYGYASQVHDIMKIFTEKLPNHTLEEVCRYIAGYFYQKQMRKEQTLQSLRDQIGDDGDYELATKDYRPTKPTLAKIEKVK